MIIQSSRQEEEKEQVRDQAMEDREKEWRRNKHQSAMNKDGSERLNVHVPGGYLQARRGARRSIEEISTGQ